MKLKSTAIIITSLIVVGIGLVLIKGSGDQTAKIPAQKAIIENSRTALEGQEAKKLPVLIDFGKGSCKACKKMKPILDELAMEYEGKAIVKIIDLRYEPKAAREYGIRLIPTQIFYDAGRNEIYRHVGFMDKQSIKRKFAEMGVY